MNIAIVGGTHGNEPVGLEVINALKNKRPEACIHKYETFQGNPKAFEMEKRFVDCDLNRAFGKNGIRKGYEKQRAEQLEAQIKGHFDLCLDIHTTTTNMGMTLILNNTHELTQRACAYLKSQFTDIKLIEEDILDEECNHLNRLSPAGITIEVGPVANNVIRGDFVSKIYEMIKSLLAWDFSPEGICLEEVEYYKVFKTLYYPEESGWYIHESIENHDFKEIHPGDILFINLEGDTIKYEGESAYPFFINEAAYLKNKSAMVLSKKLKGF